MARAIDGFPGWLSAITLLAVMTLPGCGGSGDSGGGDGGSPDANSPLRQVRDAAELESVLKDALGEVIAAGLPDTPVALLTVTLSGFSTTYTVEAGVDELDFVRFDGSNLFVASEFTGIPGTGSEIRILRDVRNPASPRRLFSATIDGVYVIDLSTPADPRIAGELLIPGVADFLHPVTEELLLGLGTDAGHVKLELYDTSVPEQPQSRGAITLGGVNSCSPAPYDRHAFTYLPGQDTDRFAIPALLTLSQPGAVETSLHQFEVLGTSSASSALLQGAGVLALPESAAPPGFSNRAFIDGDTVYYVRDGQVWSTFWATPSQVNGPF